MKDNNIELANLLNARTSRHISQAELGGDMGLSQSDVHKYETGKRAKTAFQFLIHAANYLNVSTDYILGRTTVKTSLTDIDDQVAYRLNRLQNPEISAAINKILDELETLYAQIDKKK